MSSSPINHLPVRTAGAQLTRQVSSVNMASRLGTPELVSSAHDKRVAELPISKNLNEFEKTLDSLLHSISKYTPSTEDAEKLVAINAALTTSLEDIIEHQRSGLDIDSLETHSALVDTNCKEILLGLSEYRKQLTALPSLDRTLEEEKRMSETRINADELLNYAMKLAKFTTAPPTFDSAAIGPNNFIWPAEDMLRRGMLAIASQESKKLLGEEEVVKDDEELFNEEELKAAQQQQQQPAVRRGSFGNYGEGAENGDEGDLDLDLFDPDDE